MPFAKIGPCPFTGDHWPQQWGKETITPKTFSFLHCNQKKDLIEYFYEHESAKTSARSQPAYRFPLYHLRDYFGADSKNLKRVVEKSREYEEFVAARQQSQMPPPEMSLLTAARIATCLLAKQPEEDEATRRAGNHARDSEERTSASAAQVVRQADRAAAGIKFSDGLPRNDDKFVMGGSRHGKLDSFDFGTDQHRVMVCDMQKTIEAAVKKRIADNGDLKQNEIFCRLVEEEKRKDKVKTGYVRTDARAPYQARAALSLILLLSSILWLVLARPLTSESAVCVAWNPQIELLPLHFATTSLRAPR
jgi:hypothetical protein